MPRSAALQVGEPRDIYWLDVNNRIVCADDLTAATDAEAQGVAEVQLWAAGAIAVPRLAGNALFVTAPTGEGQLTAGLSGPDRGGA